MAKPDPGSTDAPKTADSRAADHYRPSADRRGVAVCLSGGGYRAALFHLGGLTRLNELGGCHGIGRLVGRGVGLAIGVALGLVAIAFFRFPRRDLPAPA